MSDVTQYALNGRCFNGTVAGGSGITVPIYNSTSPTFALWNPAGSNRLLVLNKLTIGTEATNTTVIATLGLAQVQYAGANIGTAAPVTAFTDGVVYNGRIGRVGGNLGRIGVATTTLAAAATFFYGLGFSQALASATIPGGLISLQHNFDGGLILEPGTLVHLVGNPAAPAEALTPMLSWFELDYQS